MAGRNDVCAQYCAYLALCTPLYVETMPYKGTSILKDTQKYNVKETLPYTQ